jgi:hypothetical protein
MMADLEYQHSTERMYRSMIIATLIHNRKRHQMVWSCTDTVSNAEALAFAKPSIERWESMILAQKADDE